MKEKVWALIKTLLGVKLFDALYETFVSDELVPWAKEQWRGIFAQAEAAGVIEQSPLASPLPSPVGESPSPVETPTAKAETPTPPRRTPYLHTVRQGESLTSIAARYGVLVSTLARYNGINNSNLLRVGQQLRIP